MKLKRVFRGSTGIFGSLSDNTGNNIAVTLEHAYPGAVGEFIAKIPAGTFKCVRGRHRLHGMTEDFDTFEITGVPGHVNLLFHWGNYNADSEGCVLLGDNINVHGGVDQMITNSRATFNKFMIQLTGINEFMLEVV